MNHMISSLFSTSLFKRNNYSNPTNHILALGGADVNETNTEGESLLQQSINQNNHEASSFLIVSGGADVNLRYFRFKLSPTLPSITTNAKESHGQNT